MIDNQPESNKAIQVGFVGASHIFTGPVIHDMLMDPRLKGSELHIYDINGLRAQEVAEVSQRYVDQMGGDLQIKAVPDLKSAIVDADFVLQSSLAGGRELGDKIKKAVAEKTGIYGPIEAHAPYAQLQHMLEVAQAIDKHNPTATLIQCSNPIPEGGTLAIQETGIKFIGVCHGYKEWEHLARVMGMNPDLAQVKIAGINHNVWLLEFLYQGADAYPRLDEWIRETSEQWLKTFLPYAKNVDYQLSKAAFDLYYKAGKIMPIGDSGRASNPVHSKYGYHDSPKAEAFWFGNEQGFESAPGEASSRQWRANNINAFAQAASDNKAPVRHLFPQNSSGWQIEPIMASMATGQESTQMVNISNNGAIEGLEDRLVIEVPARVNRQGAHTEGNIRMPKTVFDKMILPRQEQALLHVDAFRHKDLRRLQEVLMMNHKVQEAGGQEVANKIIDIWRTFDPDMREHYA